MSAPVTIELASLTGPWQVIALTGATGAGSGMNLDYAIQPGLIQGKTAWANTTKTVEAASNGDWLVKSGATVLYRKTGLKPWPWTTGTWTGENSGTGTLALAKKNAIPTGIDREGSAYEGDPPVSVIFADANPPAVAALVTINPTGADNSVTYTAEQAGAVGNNISITYATPAVLATTTVAVVGTAITVTPGTKARMAVTGSLTANGSTPVVFPSLSYAGTHNGKAIYTSTGVNGQYEPYTALWGIAPNLWYLTDYDRNAIWSSPENVATPDLVTTWTPVYNMGSETTPTGTPTITAVISSAAQVIAAVNASAPAAVLVTASASGTVTGAVAAVSATNLIGGSGGMIPPVTVAF